MSCSNKSECSDLSCFPHNSQHCLDPQEIYAKTHHLKATIINIIVSQAIAHANFHPHINLLILVTRQFFPRTCTFTSVASASCWLLLWSSCFVQSLVVPTGRRALLVIKSATVHGLWISLQRVRTATGWKQWRFLFSEDLPWHFLGVLCCFGVFRTISDIVFKADFLPTDYFFERQVSCASPTHPFRRQLQRRSDIGYEYWKPSVLRYIMSLPCKTKPRVGKLRKSRCSPRWTSKNGWYKGHKLLKINFK